MFTTKARTALALASATLGVVGSALPAKAIGPTRPPAIRLQGVSTKVTVFRPAGTNNVYLRATTLKRTSTGTLVRTTDGGPISVTLTRVIIRDGELVAKVSAGPARPGVSQRACDSFAAGINYQDTQMVKHNSAGDYALGAAAAKNANRFTDDALSAGCFVVFS